MIIDTLPSPIIQYHLHLSSIITYNHNREIYTNENINANTMYTIHIIHIAKKNTQHN